MGLEQPVSGLIQRIYVREISRSLIPADRYQVRVIIFARQAVQIVIRVVDGQGSVSKPRRRQLPRINSVRRFYLPYLLTDLD